MPGVARARGICLRASFPKHHQCRKRKIMYFKRHAAVLAIVLRLALLNMLGNHIGMPAFAASAAASSSYHEMSSPTPCLALRGCFEAAICALATILFVANNAPEHLKASSTTAGVALTRGLSRICQHRRPCRGLGMAAAWRKRSTCENHAVSCVAHLKLARRQYEMAWAPSNKLAVALLGENLSSFSAF